MITREWAFLAMQGQTRCPQCEGGRTRENSCNVWDSGGYRHVMCHRASCGAFAKYPLLGHSLAAIAVPRASTELLRPYTGDRVNLRGSNIPRLEQLFGFVPPGTQSVGYTTAFEDTPFIHPILAPNGQERGVLEAVYGPNKRRRIWKAKDAPMISWTPEGDYYDGVYLVEDTISALKLWEVASVRAVALLGTHLSANAVAEIQEHANNITIALDADATAKAFMLARRWGAAFKSCHVQRLTRDIKDMPFEDIQAMVNKNNERFSNFSGLSRRSGGMGKDSQASIIGRPQPYGRVLVEGT